MCPVGGNAAQCGDCDSNYKQTISSLAKEDDSEYIVYGVYETWWVIRTVFGIISVLHALNSALSTQGLCNWSGDSSGRTI